MRNTRHHEFSLKTTTTLSHIRQKMPPFMRLTLKWESNPLSPKEESENVNTSRPTRNTVLSLLGVTSHSASAAATWTSLWTFLPSANLWAYISYIFNSRWVERASTNYNRSCGGFAHCWTPRPSVDQAGVCSLRNARSRALCKGPDWP